MMRMIAIRVAVALCLGLWAVRGVAAEGLVRGEDRIDVPAIADGLCLHSLFQSNMVIQRGRAIAVWGWAESGAEVTVSFAGEERSATAGEDRSWRVEFPPLPASSEPREMSVRGEDRTIELANILVGDVWLLGGQSNMEFEIAKVDGGVLEIASANFPNIRLMTIPQQDGPEHRKAFPRMYKWHGFFNRHFRQGDWDICSRETVREMSAIGYIFARRVHMATQIPIGLIDMSRGGTCIETWLPMDVLETVDTPEVKAKLAEWDQKVADYSPEEDLEARIRRYNGRTERIRNAGGDVSGRTPPSEERPNPFILDMNRPGNCYASMLAPIAGLAIKGALWHQGYNNAMQRNGHVMYYQLFSKMIECWRDAFNSKDMPLGIISLCTDGQPQSLGNYLEKMVDEGIYVRNVQYKTFRDLQDAGDKNIGFASSFDQRRAWYHPQIKIPVGERIACWALATQYGMPQVKWEPPKCTEVTCSEGTIKLKMNGWVRAYNDGPIQGFAICGADGRFQPATAEHLITGKDGRGRPKYDRSAVVLSSPLVPEPVHYRYAWGRNPLGNLRAGDVPFATQRTDNWALPYMYEMYSGTKPANPEGLERSETIALRRALQEEDLKRRLAEAEELLGAHRD